MPLLSFFKDIGATFGALWIAACPATAHAEGAAPSPSVAVMAGKVVSVEGRVLIRKGGDAPELPNSQILKPGMVIQEGDVLNTASDGKVKILLEDKTLLDVGASALFIVQKFDPKHGGDRSVDLSMPYGTARVVVTKPIAPGGKFQIRTRTATMGVRGTEFVVQSVQAASPASGKNPAGPRAPETKITVLQGSVAVETPQKPMAGGNSARGDKRGPAGAAHAPAPVLLVAGTQLTSNGSISAAKPVTLDTAQMAAVSTATKVLDNTFTKAVTLDVSGNGNSNGAGSSGGVSGAGEATRNALAQAIAAPLSQPIPQSNAGFIGTFSPTVVPKAPVSIPAGGVRYNIHLVLSQ